MLVGGLNITALQVEPITPEEITPGQLESELTYSRDLADDIIADLGEYRPDHLKVDIIEKMLRNGVIHSSLLMIKAPIIQVIKKSYFSSPDPIISSFLNQELLPVLLKHLETVLTSYEWGASFHEKVFEEVENLSVIVQDLDDQDGEERTVVLPYVQRLKKLKFNSYKTIDVVLVDDETDEFDGYVQKSKDGIADADGITVPVWKGFLFAPDQTETLWGKTALVPVYPAWFSYEVMSGYMVRYGERSATPPLIGRAPTGKRRVNLGNGNMKTLDNMTWLTYIAKNSGNSRAIVFPAEFDPVKGEFMWDLREMKIEDRTDFFKNVIAWLESTIHQSIFAPQQSIARTADDTGNNNLAESQFEAFLISLSRFISKLQDAFNDDIVKQVVELNFGIDQKAQLITPDVTKEITTRMFQTLSQLIRAKHPQFLNADVVHIMELLGIPVREVPEDERMLPDMGNNQPGQEPGQEEDEDGNSGSGNGNSGSNGNGGNE